MQILSKYWHNPYKCFKCQNTYCTCADNNKNAQLETARTKLVSTLNNLWSSPLTDVAKLTDEQLDKKYVPDGVCLDCRAVQQEHIDLGKKDIPKDARLSEYTEAVAKLKEESHSKRCPVHGGYDPIVMEKVTLD